MKKRLLEDPDMSLEVMMTQWPQTIPVFTRHKMLCVGCMVNPFHSVTDACVEYGLDVDAFTAELLAVVTPSPLSK